MRRGRKGGGGGKRTIKHLTGSSRLKLQIRYTICMTGGRFGAARTKKYKVSKEYRPISARDKAIKFQNGGTKVITFDAQKKRKKPKIPSKQTKPKGRGKKGNNPKTNTKKGAA